MSAVELRHQRKRALEQYAYWSERARVSAELVGRDSDSYRAADRCAMRWIGRYDIYDEMIYASA